MDRLCLMGFTVLLAMDSKHWQMGPKQAKSEEIII